MSTPASEIMAPEHHCPYVGLVAEFKTRLDANKERIDQHDEAINGNGKVGLKTDVRIIMEKMAAIDKFMSDIRLIRNAMVVSILGMFITAAFSFYILTREHIANERQADRVKAIPQQLVK